MTFTGNTKNWVFDQNADGTGRVDSVQSFSYLLIKGKPGASRQARVKSKISVQNGNKSKKDTGKSKIEPKIQNAQCIETRESMKENHWNTATKEGITQH